MAHNTYYVKDKVRFSSLWKIGTTLTDPTTVKFYFMKPDGTITIYTYPTDAQLIKNGTGDYEVQLILDTEGMWRTRWEGVGIADASKEDVVEALTSSFI